MTDRRDVHYHFWGFSNASEYTTQLLQTPRLLARRAFKVVDGAELELERGSQNPLRKVLNDKHAALLGIGKAQVIGWAA